MKMTHRQRATAIVNAYARRITGGFGLDDFSDSPTLMNGLDEAESLLKSGLEDEAIAWCRDLAREIVAEEAFPFD